MPAVAAVLYSKAVRVVKVRRVYADTLAGSPRHQVGAASLPGHAGLLGVSTMHMFLMQYLLAVDKKGIQDVARVSTSYLGIVTRSGRCLSTQALGLQDFGASPPAFTTITAMLTPLFANAMRIADAQNDADTGDADNWPTETLPPPLRSSQPGGATSISSRSTRTAQPGSIERVRRKAKSKQRRVQNKRDQANDPLPCYRPQLRSMEVYADVPAVPVTFDVRELPASHWIGRRIARLPGSMSGAWTLDNLQSMNFTYMEWDGITPQLIVDQQRRICGVMAGSPREPSWRPSIQGAASAMIRACVEAKRTGCMVGKLGPVHRRGDYYAIPSGVSFGGGSTVPGNLKIPPKLQPIVNKLLENKDIRRIAGFQSGAFAFYAPKLYNTYHGYLRRLYDRSPHLQPNFRHSIFPACTFNLGPATFTEDHTDYHNVAYGLCAVTALGNFDPRKGGHLILFDLGLVIEFPPGATILIPSSVLRHGNTPIIGEGSSRMSFTQYCAGGLFRWVDYGFQTGVSIGPKVKKVIDGDLNRRTEEALGLFSTVESLADDRAQVFGRKTFVTQ